MSDIRLVSDQVELLRRPDKGANSASGVLSAMFRKNLTWRMYNTHKWLRSSSIYFNKPHNKSNQDSGNLNKALTQNDLPWGSFKKSIDFLNPLYGYMDFKFIWPDDRESNYSLRLSIDNLDKDEIVDARTDFNDPELIVNHNESKTQRKGEPNALARLYRYILLSEGITVKQWYSLVYRYAYNPITGYDLSKFKPWDETADPETAVNGNNALMTLQRQIFENKLSWNNFRKGIKILNPKREEYILRLYWSPKPKTPDDHTTVKVAIPNPFYNAVGGSNATSN